MQDKPLYEPKDQIALLAELHKTLEALNEAQSSILGFKNAGLEELIEARKQVIQSISIICTQHGQMVGDDKC